MVGFSAIFVLFVYLYLSKVLECDSLLRNRCPTIELKNGRVRLRSGGLVARISCLPPFKLIRGDEKANCVRGKWNIENPICAREGCLIQESVPHGIVDVLNEGAKLEVKCDLGYTIDGPSDVYCTDDLEWNEELKGCKEHDQIFLLCDFESSDERFCGWKNDIFNDIDWLADKVTFILFTSRRHVSPGSSQYFQSNYISLDAGNYGSTTTGRLLSPAILPVRSKQRCLIFAYKVMSGNSNGIPILKVTFGGIPHWESHEGQGRVIIGLFKINITTRITIEGKSSKAAIDNIIITEGDSCNNLPYEDETNSCHDNCGTITFGRCSCDWECYNNNNCCPDLRIQCPYIVPMENITRLYLTNATTATKTSATTTEKNTILNVTVKNITTYSPVITIPRHNDTIIIDKITTASTIKTSNITSTFSPVSMTNLTTTVSIPLTTTTTEVLKSILFFNSTTSRPINPHSVTTSPNVATVTPNIVVDIQSNSSKIINTPSMTIIPSITSSTIGPLTVNKNFVTEQLNITPTAITKSLFVNTTISMTTTLPNISSSTSRPDKLNPTMEVIFIPSLITKSAVENTPLTTSTSVYLSNSTVKPLIKYSTLSTAKLINSSSTITKSITNKSPSTTALDNNSTKLSIQPSILDSDEQFINKSINTQQTKQNTIINENKTMLNNSTTRVPSNVKDLNDSIVPDKNMIVFDISGQNPNLKPFEYNQTSIYKDSLNITTESYSLSDLRNTSIPFKNEKPTKVLKVHQIPELNNWLHNQSTKNIDNRLADSVKQDENAKSSYTFDTITIIKYIAALGVVLLTFKFTLSFILLRFNKPSSDEMGEHFIETDNESSCNMELTSNHKE
ncbi:mucin-3B-like [Metopolophium dirhodum]|uniref:mucin-3B-like n=1 Tax=Metopolophium dirhodum TaxID=44670 RepID=UPI00298F9FB6|nr:mucin-3B-like [Metopolophium dirhodum]